MTEQASSSGTFGPTLSWKGSQDEGYDSSLYPSQATSSTEETQSRFDGRRFHFEMRPRSPPPTFTDTVLPRNRQEFILRLPQNEVDEVLSPVRKGILSEETVFAVCDLQSNVSMSIAASDMIDILRDHGRSVSDPNDYETLSVRSFLEFTGNGAHQHDDSEHWTNTSDFDDRSPRAGRKVFWILSLISVLLVFGVTIAILLWALMDTEKFSNPPPIKGCIYLIGGHDEHEGDTMEIYYPERPSKVLMPQILENGRQCPVTAMMSDGMIYIAGGNDKKKVDVSSTIVFDPKTEKIVEGPGMNEPRFWAAGTILDEKLIVCGGMQHLPNGTATGIRLKTCEYLTVGAKEWKYINDMPSVKNVMAAVSLNGYMYIIGGYNAEETWSNAVLKYDPVSDNWTQVAHLNTGRSNIAATVLDDKIVTCGGENDNQYPRECEIYDPMLDKWTVTNETKDMRNFAAMATLNGKVYLLGGVDKATVEVYDQTDLQWHFASQNIQFKRYCMGVVAVEKCNFNPI